MSIETLQPSSSTSAPTPPAGAATGTLTLLREWQSVCTAVAESQGLLLIRKGGIAEGRGGFEVKRNFFGLLPTLFHQVTNADADAVAPEPPRTVLLICQLVEAFAVPSSTNLEPLASYHAYGADQLATRQAYKPERPLHLLIVRPFRLKQSIEIAPGTLGATCRSWIDLPLTGAIGGIEPVMAMEQSETRIGALRTAIEALPDVSRIGG